LRTNDPAQPLIKLAVTANVKPVPAYVSRINGVDLAHGERIGPVSAWPTAHPSITLQRGEQFAGAIRLRPESSDSINVNPTADIVIPLNGGNSGAKPLPDDPAVFSSKIRKEGLDYWVDLNIGPIPEPGTYIRRIEAPIVGGQKVPIDVTVLVISRATLLSSEKIDLGRVSMGDLKNGRVISTRIGIRRVAGSIKITSVQTSHPFLKAEAETIFPGTNYVIRVSVDGTTLKPGSYDCSVQINTDDSNEPKIVVPCKLVITE